MIDIPEFPGLQWKTPDPEDTWGFHRLFYRGYEIADYFKYPSGYGNATFAHQEIAAGRDCEVRFMHQWLGFFTQEDAEKELIAKAIEWLTP